MTLLNRIFVAAQRNGACRNFAAPALKPSAKPSAAALSALPELPKDDRASEVTAALAFTVSFGALLLLEALDVLDFILPGEFISAPPIQLVAVLLTGGWGCVHRPARPTPPRPAGPARAACSLPARAGLAQPEACGRRCALRPAPALARRYDRYAQQGGWSALLTRGLARLFERDLQARPGP